MVEIAAITLPKIYHSQVKNTRHMRRVARLVRVQKRLSDDECDHFIYFIQAHFLNVDCLFGSVQCYQSTIAPANIQSTHSVLCDLFWSLLVCVVYCGAYHHQHFLGAHIQKIHSSYPYLRMITAITTIFSGLLRSMSSNLCGDKVLEQE